MVTNAKLKFGSKSMSLIENARVRVTDHSGLSYDAALVSLGTGWMSFHRPSGIKEYRKTQYDFQGAHITLMFPCLVLFSDNLGDQLNHKFSSTRLGCINKLSGPPALDNGDGGQHISHVDVTSRLSYDSFEMSVSGKITAEGEGRLMQSFNIFLESSIADLVEALDFTLKARVNRIFGVTK
jgi:hypothetical protein